MNSVVRRLRFRVTLFLVAVLFGFLGLNAIYKAANTIRYLDAIEAERDQWQRPSDVIAALHLSAGSVVADVGSGAGYFALKLSEQVGPAGEVLAIDLRQLPLLFLRIRAFLRSEHNIRVGLGDPNDPELPAAAVDAVLVANTFHEFANSALMLNHLRVSLRPGGRLIILDRSAAGSEPTGDARDHVISPDAVRNQLLANGWEILDQDDHFITRPGGEVWWLLVATTDQS